MRAEILYIADCPNSAAAGVVLRDALDETGHSNVVIEFRLLTSSEQAAEVPFAGSPTILLDGVDAFPPSARVTDLACRVYRSGQGPAGVPSAVDLADVIRERSDTAP
ncbi:thioredoxin family protein [Cryobacterium algoritolerans]|uniref:Thioredoxin family protein n=1 Tax=Cryobacterium algoritolerans TaxID=1259184 RepID=A0A4R8WI28_9MICO|nr:thioredoxin family protein [Cryobacterium algoritolerans]TFC10371.1 thioredoxin family protein [Cryobacterium algoritolerans]